MARASKVLLGIGIAFVAAQLVRCSHDNPPVTAEIQAPEGVQQIFERSCYDCHSNETRWPWYSQVAPVMWLVAHDVDEGREHLNFSTWAGLSGKAKNKAKQEIAEVVEKGEMPMAYYVPLHAEAKLSDEDKRKIRAWADAAE
jgi:hypothetical protein